MPYATCMPHQPKAFAAGAGTSYASSNVRITASDGTVDATGVIGWSTKDIGGGGDFGVTTSAGFDYHNVNYRMLNNGCRYSYIYSYSNVHKDQDAGYGVNTALGNWGHTGPNECNGAEGGDLPMYAAMRSAPAEQAIYTFGTNHYFNALYGIAKSPPSLSTISKPKYLCLPPSPLPFAIPTAITPHITAAAFRRRPVHSNQRRCKQQSHQLGGGASV